MQIAPTPVTAASTGPGGGGKSTIHGLQALRFFAAAIVVITHVLNREVNLYHPYPLPRAPWMESGVDIFFVISGFIMVYIIKPTTTPGAFWLQRFTRIAPFYWVATLIAFAGGLVAPDYFFGRQGWLYALQSLLFMPLGENAGAHPLVSPGWTLIYEFAFYTLLALCRLVTRPPLVLAFGLIALNLVLGSTLARFVPWLGYYADDLLMLEFLFGMVVAFLVRRLPLPAWTGLPLALLGMVLIYLLWDRPGALPRGLQAGLPSLLVVFGVLVSEPVWQRHAWMQEVARLGDASYSVYIVHFFFVTAIATVFQQNQAIHDLFGPYGYTLVSVVIGIGSGLVAHVLIEKPLLALVRSWLPARRPATRAVVPARA